jgi:hypothetical protein
VLLQHNCVSCPIHCIGNRLGQARPWLPPDVVGSDTVATFVPTSHPVIPVRPLSSFVRISQYLNTFIPLAGTPFNPPGYPGQPWLPFQNPPTGSIHSIRAHASRRLLPRLFLLLAPLDGFGRAHDPEFDNELHGKIKVHHYFPTSPLIYAIKSTRISSNPLSRLSQSSRAQQA